MSTTANRTRGAVPIRVAAVAAALALLVTPVPASAGSATRTVLLTLTGATSLSQLADAVTALGGRVVQSLDLSDSLLVELPQGVGAPAGSAEVPDVAMKVNGTQSLDSPGPADPTYLETIGADGVDASGAGVTVALVDTGVAAGTVEVLEHINVTEAPDGDGLGHGTFLAGLIKGTSEMPGVAPDAEVLDVQVAEADGSTSLSQVLSGLQAIADRDVDVLNLSLSTNSPLPASFDPLARALDRLWMSGVTVITSAGNDGPHRGSVGSPGNDPLLITVGAQDEAGTADRSDDSVAAFSSRGTRYSAVKPDLVAPGVSLVSTTAPGSIADDAYAGPWEGTPYMQATGTSMSAAVVAGSVAVLLSRNAELEPNGVKALLKATASGELASMAGAGAGALDLATAFEAAETAPVNPPQGRFAEQPDDWGPAEEDELAWAEFAEAWAAGDFEGVKEAWAKLSWQTQQWAARSWSMAVVVAALHLPEPAFEARSWSARSWSFDEWLARSWSARSWSARSWSYEEWLARSWSARSWSARSWSARSWSADEWLARSWSARSWSFEDWAARSWSARSWSARSWSARSWSDFAWDARSWSARSWSARSWSMDA